jgi:hypothetical protein
MHANQILTNSPITSAEFFLRRLLPFYKISNLVFTARKKTNDLDKNNQLRLEISYEKMNELLASHLICAADIRCMDAHSKRCLKYLCLKTCLDTALSEPIRR